MLILFGKENLYGSYTSIRNQSVKRQNEKLFRGKLKTERVMCDFAVPGNIGVTICLNLSSCRAKAASADQTASRPVDVLDLDWTTKQLQK